MSEGLHLVYCSLYYNLRKRRWFWMSNKSSNTLTKKSRMNREVHVRFCERFRGETLLSTRLLFQFANFFFQFRKFFIIIVQITSSEILSYSWAILFLVPIIFWAFLISISEFLYFKILLIASPIISIFRSTAFLFLNLFDIRKSHIVRVRSQKFHQ